MSKDGAYLQSKVTDLIHRESGSLLLITDSDGFITTYNDENIEGFSNPEREVLGQRIENVVQRVDSVKDVPASLEGEVFFGILNGQKLKLKTSTIVNKDGSGTAYFVIIKRIEDMAQDYIDISEEAKILFDRSPLPMALVDPGMRAKTINDAARELLHIESDADFEDGRCGELVGCYNSTYGKGCGTNRPCKDCIIRNTVNATFKDRRSRDKVEGDFLVMRNGSAEMMRIQVWTRLIGYQNKVLLAINDITDFRTVERSLLEANKKMNLMSSITRHDTLNSLTTLSLLLEIVSDAEGFDETSRSYLNRMHGVVKDMGEQINFTKVYQDLGTHEPRWQPLAKIIRESVPDHMPLKLLLDASVEGREILADPMLPRVFHNIMENAVRHGGNASEIRVSTEQHNGNVCIIIQDNGNGVADSDKESIFKRGHGKNSGLGLFLSKEILSITDLSISEVGEYGKGARFLIGVPLTSHRLVG